MLRNAAGRWVRSCVAALLTAVLLTACGGANRGSGGTPPSFTVSGAVIGLSGSGLVLEINGGSDLSMSADGRFTFATTAASGTEYTVTIKTPPTRRATCT
jgi:hypothetical protein